MAWLGQPIDAKQPDGPSRAAARAKRGEPLNLPCVEASHLLDVLNSAGWCQPAGLGVAPVSSQELLSWAYGADVHLEPWEFLALKAASAAYCSQQASKDAREPVFDPETHAPQNSPVRALAEALNRKKDAK